MPRKHLWQQVKRHRLVLEKLLEPRFGLLEKLLGDEILSREEYDLISSEAVIYRTIRRLLDCVMKSDNKFEPFVAALKGADQQHIVNYLEHDGHYQNNDDWPLTVEEQKRINRAAEELVLKLDADDIMTQLYAKELLNTEQRDTISAKETRQAKVRMFIDILLRRNQRTYKETIELLRNTNQGHIAEMLEKGGVVGKVSVYLTERHPEKVKEIEFAIINRLRESLRSSLQSIGTSLKGLLSCGLAEADQGNSILLFFHRVTVEQLDELWLKFGNGELHKMIESSFNEFNLTNEELMVRINWPIEDYRICRSLLTGQTEVNDLTGNLLDMIFEKVFLLWMLERRDMLIKLSSVNSKWSSRFRLPAFKNIMQYQLSDMHRTGSKVVCTLKSPFSSPEFKYEICGTIPGRKLLKQKFEYMSTKWLPGHTVTSDSESGYYSKYTGESISDSLSDLSSIDVDAEICYKMDHSRRGYCLIFNNIDFPPQSGFITRKGALVDEENMKQVFERLGFDVCVHHNLRTFQMLKISVEMSRKDHSDRDCFAFVIMTHCHDGNVYGSDGSQMHLNIITSPLKDRDHCPSLMGKPKMFFIVSDAAPSTLYHRDVSNMLEEYPQEADCLYAFSTSSGYSFRSTFGSWFIQALTKVFEKHGTELEIMQLLTRVNRITMTEFTSKTTLKDFNGKKQLPAVMSMLTKLLYFHPK